MTDTLEQEPQAAATVDPRQARESARREIDAALARMGAIDDARTALALIAESALRYGADAGARGYRIVNENGEPRVSSGGGQAGDFTIAELVAELRRKHPTLFK